MDTLTFTARLVGVDESEYALVAGVATSDSTRYVTFQRDPSDSAEDWGIYIEFNDQSNSGYECIRHCTLSRTRLRVELIRPIDSQRRIIDLAVKLHLSHADLDIFAVMLRRIFRQREALLTISSLQKSD